MLSLKERSLLAALSNVYRIDEVFDFCDSDNQIADVCSSSKAFWLSILPQVNFGIISLAYEPLKEKYWFKMLENLKEGVVYKYYLGFIDGDLEDLPEGSAVQLKTIREYGPTYDGSNFYNLNVPFLKLRPGTFGWHLKIRFNQVSPDDKYDGFFNQYETLLDQEEFLLCSPDQDDDQRIIKVMALMLNRSLDSYQENRDYEKDPKYAFVEYEFGSITIEEDIYDLTEAKTEIYDWSIPSLDDLERIITKEYYKPYENGVKFKSTLRMFRGLYEDEPNKKEYWRQKVEIVCDAIKVKR